MQVILLTSITRSFEQFTGPTNNDAGNPAIEEGETDRSFAVYKIFDSYEKAIEGLERRKEFIEERYEEFITHRNEQDYMMSRWYVITKKDRSERSEMHIWPKDVL